MIPKYSRGTSFDGLIRYLVHVPGRGGLPRPGATVLSVQGVLGIDTAAIEMAAVARRSERIRKPVVHLSLSLAPSERLDDARWRAVVDRAERELGLIGHQRVVVRHDDADHSHAHVAWNAIHPETSRTPVADWDKHIKWRLSALCRVMEREMGLGTPGRLRMRSDQQVQVASVLVSAPPDVVHVSPGQQSRERRTGELPLAETHGARIKAALRQPTWDARAADLAAIGLRFRFYSTPRNPRRRGLVIEDICNSGRRCVGSDLGADYGLGALERRSGETLDRWLSRQPAQPQPEAACEAEVAHVGSDQDGALRAAYMRREEEHRSRRDDLRRARKLQAHEHLLRRTAQRVSQHARRRRVWRAKDSPGMRWLIGQIADWRERRERRALLVQQRRESEELSKALGAIASQGWSDFLALQEAAGDADATRILARMKCRERLQADRIHGVVSDTRPLDGRAQTRVGALSVQTSEVPSLSLYGVRSHDPSETPIVPSCHPAGSSGIRRVPSPRRRVRIQDQGPEL